MKRFVRKNNIVYKKFSIYLIIFIIPLFFMGMFFYTWMTGIITQQTEHVYKEALGDVRNSIDKEFLKLDDLSNTMAKSTWVRKIALMNSKSIDYSRIDYTTINDYLNELDNYRSLNGVIEQCAIYFHNMGLIFHTDGIDDIEWFFTQKYKYDGIKPENWAENMGKILPSDLAMIILPKEVVKYTNSIGKVFTYVKTIPIVDNRIRATLIIIIKEQKIADMLERAKINENSSIFLFNGRDEHITDFNGKSEMMQVIREQKLEHGENLLTKKVRLNDGAQYFVIHTASKYLNNWMYTATLPVSDVMKEVSYVKYLTLALTFLILIVEVIFIYWLAKREYKPIKHLSQIIKDTFQLGHSSDSNYNEYELIEHGIRDMKSEIENYQSITIGESFRKLLNGQFEEVRDKKLEAMLRHKYCRLFFSAVIFKIQDSSPSILYEMDFNKIHEKLTLEKWNVCLLRQGDKLLGIVNVDTKEDLDSAILETCKAIGMETVAASGGLYMLELLWKSYNEAKAAFDYRALKDHVNIIHYADIEVKNKTISDYPSYKKDDLVDCLNNNNSTNTRSMLSEYLRYSIIQSSMAPEVERYFSYKNTQKLLNNLQEEEFIKIIKQNKEYLLLKRNTLDFNGFLEKICKIICENSLNQKETYEIQLQNDIKEYVEKNFMDPDMSLSKLADIFGMSTSQLSRFFKEKLDVKFVDYISMLRVKAAIELLLKGDQSVEEIGRKVGYENALTFRRVFKKFEHLTPGKFR